MNTKLFKNVGGEDHPFLVFHISTVESIVNLEKFVGGGVESVDHKHMIITPHGARSFEVGDYVVHLTNATPYSRVRVSIDKVRHQLPKESFMFCKPSEFLRNFKEVGV